MAVELQQRARGGDDAAVTILAVRDQIGEQSGVHGEGHAHADLKMYGGGMWGQL